MAAKRFTSLYRGSLALVSLNARPQARPCFSIHCRVIFDLARFLFPWFILPRRWRSSLFSKNPGESTQTVCSTMIAEAFGSIEFPILPLVKRTEGNRVKLYRRNPKLCTPSDFDYSPYFDIIKYPFLDFQNYAEQRLEPWDGASKLSAEERDYYLDGGALEEENVKQ